jgi:hypothetical protein
MGAAPTLISPRYKLRHLFLLTVIVAVCLAALKYDAIRCRDQWTREQAICDKLTRMGALLSTGNQESFLKNPFVERRWRIRTTGVIFDHNTMLLWHYSPLDADLDEFFSHEILNLPYLRVLALDGPAFRDSHLRCLPRLHLSTLALKDASITESGISELADCVTIETLIIDNFGGSFRNSAEALELAGDHETVASGVRPHERMGVLHHFVFLPKLKRLELTGLGFSTEAVEAFRAARPDVQIRHAAFTL